MICSVVPDNSIPPSINALKVSFTRLGRSFNFPLVITLAKDPSSAIISSMAIPWDLATSLNFSSKALTETPVSSILLVNCSHFEPPSPSNVVRKEFLDLAESLIRPSNKSLNSVHILADLFLSPNNISHVCAQPD